MIFINHWIVPKGKAAITLWPFIFLKYHAYNSPELINHEKIHLQQQAETLVIPFYAFYVLNFIFNILTMNKLPYRRLQAEKEAYANQDNLEYLKTRKRWRWIIKN